MNDPLPPLPSPQPPAPGDVPPTSEREVQPRSSIPSVERKPEALGGGLEGAAPAAERTAREHQI